MIGLYVSVLREAAVLLIVLTLSRLRKESGSDIVLDKDGRDDISGRVGGVFCVLKVGDRQVSVHSDGNGAAVYAEWGEVPRPAGKLQGGGDDSFDFESENGFTCCCKESVDVISDKAVTSCGPFAIDPLRDDGSDCDVGACATKAVCFPAKGFSGSEAERGKCFSEAALVVAMAIVALGGGVGSPSAESAAKSANVVYPAGPLGM